jgi:hypothetical protein
VPPDFRGDKIEDMHLEQPEVFIERDWTLSEHGRRGVA